MSVQTEINRISGAVSDAKSAIAAKGVNVPETANVESLAALIDLIEAGSGGTSDKNCEAYHITSTSDAISFKGSGTVKVWGYGYKSGGYIGTQYSFVGDGYYSGSYGTPSKTTASFSINADGTLSGLPSGLTAVNLLVTIGV